jgi:hypothetical protein
LLPIVQDLTTLLEEVARSLQRGRYPDKAHGNKIASVLRVVAALAGDDAELHALARLERGHPVREHGGVHEDVAAVVAGKEAEALLAVEPLDLAGRHVRPRPQM